MNAHQRRVSRRAGERVALDVFHDWAPLRAEANAAVMDDEPERCLVCGEVAEFPTRVEMFRVLCDECAAYRAWCGEEDES